MSTNMQLAITKGTHEIVKVKYGVLRQRLREEQKVTISFMSTKKITLILFPIVLIGFIGAFIYFITGITSTSPPIKEYGYSGTANNLISSFQKYAMTNPDLTLRITDTTGNVSNGYAIFMTVRMKDIEYRLKFEEDNSSAKCKTMIKLVLAYDRSRNVGGYSKDAEGVDVLVDLFDKDILDDLKNKLGIEIFSC